MSLSLSLAGIVGLNVQRSLHLQYHDEVPLSKAPNPQLFPGRHSCPLLRVCVCVFTAVCVHLDGYMQSMNSENGSPYLAVCHVTFTFMCGEHSLSIVISFLTKMAFRGFCIGIPHVNCFKSLFNNKNNYILIA